MNFLEKNPGTGIFLLQEFSREKYCYRNFLEKNSVAKREELEIPAA
jgi:hypothetical protein